MTTFISPKPHEKAAWHAAARRNIAALQAQADARDVAKKHALAFDACQKPATSKS